MDTKTLNTLARASLPRLKLLLDAITPFDNERERIRELVMQERERRRAQSIRERVHKKEWRKLTAPLKRELANAEVGLAYESSAALPERTKAFSLYVDTLRKLLTNLHRYQQEQSHEAEPLTPIELAKRSKIPNNGHHWTDWIPYSAKDRVFKAFAEIPVTAKARRKVPFQRVIPPKQNRIDRARLQGQITRLLNAAETDEDGHTQLDLMAAQNRLDSLSDTSVIPTSWRDL
jgi:hypothetical protein